MTDQIATVVELLGSLYNIIKTETGTSIEICLAGFKKDEIRVKVKRNILYVTAEKKEKSKREYQYRSFDDTKAQCHFSLRDDVEVKDATYENGLLVITAESSCPDTEARVIEIK